MKKIFILLGVLGFDCIMATPSISFVTQMRHSLGEKLVKFGQKLLVDKEVVSRSNLYDKPFVGAGVKEIQDSINETKREVERFRARCKESAKKKEKKNNCKK